MACMDARRAAAALILSTLSLAVIPAEPASSGVQPSPNQASAPLEEIQELDEVFVQGKRLMERIVEAENEFYKLFNAVNSDDRYDTHCVYLQMQEGSRMQSRACIPGFVADALADWAPFKARCQPPLEMEYGRDGPEFACLDRDNNGRLTLQEASAREELAAAFFEIDLAGDRNGDISGDEFQRAVETRADLSAPPVHMPATPDAILMEGTKKWHDHMTAVVNGDARLHEMAAHLGDMYYELSRAQRRFEELDAAAKPKNGKVRLGPRVR
jgi:hypothetical protein